MHEVLGACPLDCPDGCSWVVTVENGEAVNLKGNREHPFTAGALCAKVNGYLEHAKAPDRLLYPLKRIGRKGEGRFERISWDMALDDIYKRVNEIVGRWGPQAVMPLNYAGPHGLLAGDSMSSRFFNRLGATQLYRRALCGGVGRVTRHPERRMHR